MFVLHDYPFSTPEYPPVRWKSVHWTLVFVNIYNFYTEHTAQIIIIFLKFLAWLLKERDVWVYWFIIFVYFYIICIPILSMFLYRLFESIKQLMQRKSIALLKATKPRLRSSGRFVSSMGVIWSQFDSSDVVWAITKTAFACSPFAVWIEEKKILLF